MKTTAFLVAAMAAVAYGQVEKLSACAQGCTFDNLDITSCDLKDYSCLCADKLFFSTISKCISSQCSKKEAKDATDVAHDICESVGVPLPSKNKDDSSDEGETVVSSSMFSSEIVVSATATVSAPGYSSTIVLNATTTATSGPPPVATFTGAAAPLKKGSWAVGALGVMLVGAL